MDKKKLSVIILVCLLGFSGIFTLICKYRTISYVARSLHNQVRVFLFADELVRKSKITVGTYDTEHVEWESGPIVHSWNYCNGIMMKALLKLGFYNDFVNRFYSDNITKDGYVNNIRNRYNIYVKGAVDDIIPARTVFYLLKTNNSKKYKKNLMLVRDELEKQPTMPELGDNYINKINNRAWVDFPFGLDGLYATLPYLLEYDVYVAKSIKPHTKNVVFKRLDWISKNLKNEVGLYNHGCKPDGKTVNGVVWGRGVGWYAMAQVEILELFPEGEQKEILKEELKEFFDAMINYQDKETGMWYNIIYPENPDVDCNYLEPSVTAMMAYSLMSAYINDFVTDKKYAYHGLKAFNGVVENNLRKIGFNKQSLQGVYKVAIVYDNPSQYAECSYYVENDPKGVAPLIFASTLVDKTFKKLFINMFK